MNVSHFLTMMMLVFLPANLSSAVQASNTLTVSSEGGSFCLFANGKCATVSVSPTEPLVVQKAAQLFAEDVERVTGTLPKVSARPASLTIATLGHNKRVDQLVAKGRLDVGDIGGGWERCSSSAATGGERPTGCSRYRR